MSPTRQQTSSVLTKKPFSITRLYKANIFVARFCDFLLSWRNTLFLSTMEPGKARAAPCCIKRLCATMHALCNVLRASECGKAHTQRGRARSCMGVRASCRGCARPHESSNKYLAILHFGCKTCNQNFFMRSILQASSAKENYESPLADTRTPCSLHFVPDKTCYAMSLTRVARNTEVAVPFTIATQHLRILPSLCTPPLHSCSGAALYVPKCCASRTALPAWHWASHQAHALGAFVHASQRATRTAR